MLTTEKATEQGDIAASPALYLDRFADRSTAALP